MADWRQRGAWCVLDTHWAEATAGGDQSRAIELALRNGMQPCFETARMYTGTFPALPLDKVFGITSFELG